VYENEYIGNPFQNKKLAGFSRKFEKNFWVFSEKANAKKAS